MNENDLKRYTVILGTGSGVLFQPLDESITYILSAKHVFYEKVVNDDGPDTEKLVSTIKYTMSDNQNNGIDVLITKGTNYFEHKTADAAILLIDKIIGYDKIFINEECTAFNECFLCGYSYKISENRNDRYTNYQINRNISTTQNEYLRLEINFGNLNHQDILGFSGGGILRLSNDVINIIGILSSTITDYANGHIDVVPINTFIEIVEENNLSEMIPPFMASFEFLKDKAFDIYAGIYDDNISFTRKFLKDKTIEVINSDITPLFIKDLFKERLLINESEDVKLKDELIYVTWLEFLTLINIAKETTFTQNDLKSLFSKVRLLYKNTNEDWQSEDFLKYCLSSNYNGLIENGTVFIKTKSNPIAGDVVYYKLKKGSMVPRIDSFRQEYENGTLTVNNIGSAVTDLDEFAFDKYNFIHFEYLKKYMLIEKSNDFKGYNKSKEKELLTKLKEKYEKVFGI